MRIFKAAPNPNAARLLQAWMCTPECQQLCIDHGGLRSVHAQAKEKPGRMPLAKIKLMKDDAAAVEKQSRGDQEALQPDVRGVTRRRHRS